MSQTTTELFLDKYRYLEHMIKSKYQLSNWTSVSNYLEEHSEFRDYLDEFAYCRDVRNLLSHKPKINGTYCVDVSEELIHMLDNIIRVLEKPPVIYDVSVPMNGIMFKSFEDNLVETLQQMNEKGYGNVPILKNGVVQGVISEKAILSYIVKEKQFHISEELTLMDLKKYFLLENQKRDYYQFVKRDTLISDVAKRFHDSLNQGVRIGMVFLTKNGLPNEKLQGIATAWDLAGRK